MSSVLASYINHIICKLPDVHCRLCRFFLHPWHRSVHRQYDIGNHYTISGRPLGPTKVPVLGLEHLRSDQLMLVNNNNSVSIIPMTANLRFNKPLLPCNMQSKTSMAIYKNSVINAPVNVSSPPPPAHTHYRHRGGVHGDYTDSDLRCEPKKLQMYQVMVANGHYLICSVE